MTSFDINDVIGNFPVCASFLSSMKNVLMWGTQVIIIKMNNLEDLEISAHILLVKCLDSFPDLITQHLCNDVFREGPWLFEIIPDKFKKSKNM